VKPLLDLAVVTSCHNYGRYLAEWTGSLVALTTWPRVVALVDNGSTDATPAQMEAAARLLRAAGLPDVRTERMALANFGAARNRAVELGAGTEWVMHMDADDTFMPHCLDEVARLMPSADVIPLGYQRSGDLAAGPSNRTRLYQHSRGQSTLKSSAPASGVSPFRRALWEHTPYRDDMPGGWDTALWIGFAHQNARFVAVRTRPCFFYRQHADSIFNTRRVNRRRGRRVGAKLQNLRRGRTGVSVLVPRRSDGGGPRDVAWAWLRARYEALYPEWEVVEGTDIGGPFCKGAAVADAVGRSRGNTLVIADADCVMSAEALREAVALVEIGEAPWVVPHTLVHRLDRAASEAVVALGSRADPPFKGAYARKAYVGFAGGGFIVVDASAWDATGGMPMAFAGWGAEDEATAVILDTLVGPHVRLEHDLWHLWHPHARSDSAKAQQLANRVLYRQLASLAGDPDALFGVLERLALGEAPEQAVACVGAGVLMVALMDFQRGTEVIKRGGPFLATEDEARRHETRPRKIAVRADSPLAHVRRQDLAEMAAARNKQRARNDAARQGAEERVAALHDHEARLAAAAGD
jgi:GT2 family glycosyltransferase